MTSVTGGMALACVVGYLLFGWRGVAVAALVIIFIDETEW